MNDNDRKRIAQNQLNNQKWYTTIRQINEQARIQGKMTHVTFELTPMCTLACKMCFVRLDKSQMDSIGKMRSAGEWIDMARQFRDAGGFTMLLTGGEAMSRPDFAQIYEAISKMGILVTVFTNGTTITDEIIELFTRRPPFLIGLTLYGASEETYERTTGVRSFQKALDGLDRLLSINNLKLDVRFTACSLNYMDYPRLQEMMDERGIIISTDQGSMSSVRGAISDARSLRLNKEQEAEFRRHVRENSAPILDMMHQIKEDSNISPMDSVPANADSTDTVAIVDTVEDRRLKCNAAAWGSYIAFDGRMYPCDTFSEPYCTYPFRDGYEEACLQLRELAKDILVPSDCYNCINLEKCGPCAAKLIAEKDACRRAGISCGFTPKQ